MAATRRKRANRRAGRARADKSPAACSIQATSSRQVLARLAEVARIGALFIEGEDCINALRPEARAWKNGDDINFDPRVAVPLKKTLLRIEMIERFTYYAVLWCRRPDDRTRAELVLCGRMGSALWGGPRDCPRVFPALRSVFDRGRPASVAVNNPAFERTSLMHYGHVWIARHDSLLRAGGRVISCFHPIRDSREEVVAALELTCAGSDH